VSNFDELSRELRDRSHDIDGHPIGFDAVKRSAHRIQRRRRIASAAVAAAVLAVAVPTALAATNGATSSRGVVGQPTPPVNTPSAPVTLTTAGIPRGANPVIPFLDGRTLLLPDGRTETLPAAYTSITPFRAGWLANAFTHGELSVVQLDADNRVISNRPGGDGFALSGDRVMVSWFVAGTNGQPGHLFQGLPSGMSEGQASLETPPGVQIRPVGFTDDGVVYESDGTDPEVRITQFDGHSSVIRGALAASGVSQVIGRIAVQTESTDRGSCWAVVDAEGTPDWSTCDYSLGRLSPDGKYVVGTDPYGDGLGASWVAVLDASDGHEVARYARADNGSLFIADLAWEDDTHLLAVVWENGEWSVVRMDPDGGLQEASKALAADETSRPFWFAATP